MTPLRAHGVGRRSAGLVVVAVAGAVVLHNVLVMAGLNEPATLIVNLALTGVLYIAATKVGFTPRELGLHITSRSASMALAAAALVATAVAFATVLHLLPADANLATVEPSTLWFRAAVGIPIGTALCEELVFRGVLLAALDRLTTRRTSTLVTSAMFGLWHIAAEALRVAPRSAGGSLGPAELSGAVLGGVLVTAGASAFVLCPLRRRCGDIAVPTVAHAVTNVSVLIAIFFVSSPAG